MFSKDTYISRRQELKKLVKSGAHLIIINNTQTYLNVRADVTILEDVAMIIPAITERVFNG